MRAYVVHNGDVTQSAVLVFHHTARKARYLGWTVLDSWGVCDDYIEARTIWIKDDAYLQTLKVSDLPHYIESPPSCDCCEKWPFHAPLDEEGMCETCRDEAEADRLLEHADIP